MAQFAAGSAQAATTQPPSFTNEPNPTSIAPLTATISSPESSSSGDRRGDSSRTTADTNNELNPEALLEAAYEPMWDWEQLNWF